MGVNGLWAVVQPCARPTNLATLNRKRLAVDASIWIYQFLKAVRDKEGNALRNSHVVGFFRRICKLLWFGIQPVFVFDGGAPALKRATIQARKRRREGRREDAVKTAGKLLAVQMQRIAEEENDRRKRDRDQGRDRDVSAREEEQQQQEEEIPDASKMVYVDEIGMSQTERQQTRKFFRQDAYHLPELNGGIAAMGKPEDPRIMSVEELEAYARQFHDGEDVNLYDFSKIDFNGDFFKSLPPPDRYNILNAARLRSRLRMGYSKDQLDDMFPDRMAFSRFQIERVKERNHLTQRLMYETGMISDSTVSLNARVAGERDREYILVKNDGAEGGWALGVVSKEKDVGEAHKPIDVDAIEIQYQSKEAEDEASDEDFEDVPIEGVNRLPKPSQSRSVGRNTTHLSAPAQQQYDEAPEDGSYDPEDGTEESLFVSGDRTTAADLFGDQPVEQMHHEEEDDVNQAIALSLQNQHGAEQLTDDEEQFEDVPMDKPEWTQKPAEAAKAVRAGGGSMIAHIVNNRANAAVPKRQEAKPAAVESDSDEDMQAVLARSRKSRKMPPKPAVENKKNPFDGPLPFPRLDWESSLFSKKASSQTPSGAVKPGEESLDQEDGEDLAGGFEAARQGNDKPKPLPPWLADEGDIRESVKKQQDAEREINAEDKAEAEEEERQRRREMKNRTVQIESSSEDGSDVEVIDAPPSPKQTPKSFPTVTDDQDQQTVVIEDIPMAETSEQSQPVVLQIVDDASPEVESEAPLSLQADAALSNEAEDGRENTAPPTIQEEEDVGEKQGADATASPAPDLEDVPLAEPSKAIAAASPPSLTLDDVSPPVPVEAPQESGIARDDDELFADVDYDEFSDPGDEELLAQMAEEAEEHGRFASELNKKSAHQNKEDYEKELRALRGQQKKDRRDADEVTQVMVSECQALLRLFGIPYITAPMEAEAQCAELVKLGLADGIVTDDSDTFLFGGTRVYKNMFNGNKFVECYLAPDLDKELSLSRDQLISLAQLLGSDYTEGLSGVGPVTAVEILSEFSGQSGLEEFREWWTEVQSHTRPKDADASSPFRKKFRKSQATKLFLPPGFPSPVVYDAYLHPDVDASSEPFQWGVPNLEGLRQFLMATIGWSKERTDEVLVPVIKDMNKREVEGTQSNITRFFGGGVGVGAKEAFAPRQRAQGSKRMAAAVDKLRANVAGRGTEVEEGPNKRRRTTAAPVEGVDADDAVDESTEVATTSVTNNRGKGKGKGKGKRAKAHA